MKDILKKLVWIAVGQLIATIGFSRVLVANDLVATGFGGFATVLHVVTGVNVQLMLVLMALPVFIWSFFFFEKMQIFYAAFSYFIFTFYLGLVDRYVPAFHTDGIIAAVVGAVILGVGGGIIMKQRVANGPEAVVGLYLKKKTGLTVGTYFMVLNSAIILSSIIYGDLTMIAYSFISTYIMGVVTDYVMIGGKKYYNVSIMSDQYLEITDFIRLELKRGVTFVQGMDTSNVKKKMLLQTVMTKMELVALRDYVKSLEDDSFVYANQSASILGRGFDLD